MESVVIVAPWPYDKTIRDRLASVKTEPTADDGIYVEDGVCRCYIARNDYVRDELEVGDLQFVLERIKNPVFYTIDYLGAALCRTIVIMIANDSAILVDNTHGVVLWGDDFVRLLHERPDWDIRNEPASLGDFRARDSTLR